MAKKRTKRHKLSSEELAENKLKRSQTNEIRTVFKNMGFIRLPNIDGKEVNYRGRTTEMDDIFICENIILITEYTISKKAGDHLINKSLFYNKVIEDERAFIDFLIKEPKLNSFKNYFEEHIKQNYSVNQLRLKIIYCSRNSISEEHRHNITGIVFFDYHIVQYFKSLTKVIKRTGRYEFLDFINIPFDEFGVNIQKSDQARSNKYSGHILPEEKSNFKVGYKIVSFYIDANSLMRRAYVLRQEGWRKKENIGYYQRMLEVRKINSMRKYLAEKERVFINNIISTISEDKIKLLDNDDNEIQIDEDGQFKTPNKSKAIPTKIEITDECNIIGLIDGQHRTFAYHEGDDIYEEKIKHLRKVQNLLVTGVIFPKKETKETRLKFEANLFLEINTTQTNVKSQLTQEIELMINPFSTISIGKRIMLRLNENGPFKDIIEQYSFERGKLKTASIVSFGLKPLIKLDEKSTDSLFYHWNHPDKIKLNQKNSDEYRLLDEYVEFSFEKIRDIFIGVKRSLNEEQWNFYSHSTQKGILNVTFFNGILNLLRFLIENNQVSDHMHYHNTLKNKNFHEFHFKAYKSSQYRKMGGDIYNSFFKSEVDEQMSEEM